MTQQLRELAAFEENLSLIPKTCVESSQMPVTQATVETMHCVTSEDAFAHLY